MIKKILFKSSSLLLKAHLYLKERANVPKNLVPYVLKYQPNKKNKKIVHVISNFMIGGSTQLMVDIIERTSDKYFHQIVVPEYLKPLPYQPVDIHSFSINEMNELYNFLKNEKPELVHIHYYVREITKYEGNAFWYYAVFKICEDLKIKVIQNVNVPTEPYLSDAVVHNVFVSKYVEDNFNTSDASKSIIYPGSDFSHFNYDTNLIPDNSIGMVYRLDNDKLREDSIDVFIRAVKKKADIHCYIIGGGYYLEYYKQKVKEKNLENNFTFTGFVSYRALPELYKKIGVFVAPVYDESFGQVTPFAMSMGLSVAGYDTGALSEILGYKVTLVETGNIESLADVIVDLVNNPNKRKELGLKNQKRARENFSVESMTNQYEKLYEIYCK